MGKKFTVKNTNMAKGLAVSLMLFYHLFENRELVVSQNVIYSPFSLDTFLTLSGFGNVCVSVFVFLTSFGIATGLLQQEDLTAKRAYIQAAKRFRKLMIHFFVLYLSVNLLWWHWLDYQSLYGVNKQGAVMALTDSLGLSMFFNTPTMNLTWWYMEIAYILIFLVPLLTWLVKKTGNTALLLACFAPFILVIQQDVQRYLFVAVFGVCAAQGNWLDKLLNKKWNPALKWLFCIAGFIFCVLLRQNYVVYNYYVWLADAPISLFLIYFAGGVIGDVPVLRDVFAFIGKHSLNIYLVHTFFYMALWQKYIYHFRYAGLTFLLLLAVCLLYSVVLEALKNLFAGLYRKIFRREKNCNTPI